MMSVQEASKKFDISSRRVQKLCEEGRITGARMISNVWLIPQNAEKPKDERATRAEEGLITLADLCQELSISVATGRNWVKLGKIVPETTVKRTPCFTWEYVADLKKNIQSGSNTALKSRRNKKYVSGNNIYNSYVSSDSKNLSIVKTVVEQIEKKNIVITEDLIKCLIADCALQMICGLRSDNSFSEGIADYMVKDPLIAGNTGLAFLIRDILSGVNILQIVKKYPSLFCYKYRYEETEDTLGLLYISLRNVGNRKATGSYYTPTNIVKKLCSSLFEKTSVLESRILDPCCGTGNFILQLPQKTDAQNVFGNDIDELSVKIARINYALKFRLDNYDFIVEHITHNDYLRFDSSLSYDIILGNPPWGYEFSDESKEFLRSKFRCAVGNNIESYDVFIEQGLSNLSKNGVLAFVLPEAVLNVKAHTPIREVICSRASIRYLAFLGNAFYKVQCPCIIMEIVNTEKELDSSGMKVEEGGRTFTISDSRTVSPEGFSFLMTDEEYRVLRKIEGISNAVYLKDNSSFALGIVTGNNKEYISNVETDGNEVILKGSDIYKYRFVPSNNFIVFKPESFQQIAPTAFYRAKEKLLYRFICNQLVFAYDDNQTLSLNSCNILIPEFKDLQVKYVLTILNSRIAQYYFKRTFNSVKVLRSHIEAIPIPHVDQEEQKKLVFLCDQITAHTDLMSIKSLYDALDREVATLYGLSEEEHLSIVDSMVNENLFLI